MSNITLENGITLSPIRLQRGVAGQVAATVTVTYPGEDGTRVQFVGSVYGGPVVSVHPRWGQLLVSAPERFGDFHVDPPRWVRNFFA